ncbi:MAG: Ig-like domain-containing protein [Eubacteriales bacterium]
MKRFLSLLLTVVIVLSALPAALAEDSVRMKKINLDRSMLTLEPDATWAMFWETLPANATNSEVSWSSSNEKIATVNQYGIITAHKTGECSVTAIAQDGTGVRASVKVTVKEHEITILEPGDVDVDFETEEDTVKISLTINGKQTTKKVIRLFRTKHGCVTSPENMVIRPALAGSDTISIVYNNNRKLMKAEHYTVFVAQEAVGEAPRVNEDGSPAPIRFLNIPWGSNWPTTMELMEARNKGLKAISERNDYLRSMVSGEIIFGNLTAFSAALNYSFRKNDRMFETRNSFNNGDLYFDPSIPFETIAKTARTLYCLDEGVQDGNTRTWQRGHVTVRLEQKERYTILEVLWDGVDEEPEEAGDDAEELE